MSTTDPSSAGPRVESFGTAGQAVAVVVRAGSRPAETAFVTDDADSLQLGFIVSPAGREIVRHVHRPAARTITRTAEILCVESGRCEMDLYDDDLAFLATVDLGPGDVALLLGGGHGFRMTEATVLLEIKQGPYPGPDEKVPF